MFNFLLNRNKFFIYLEKIEFFFEIVIKNRIYGNFLNFFFERRIFAILLKNCDKEIKIMQIRKTEIFIKTLWMKNVNIDKFIFFSQTKTTENFIEKLKIWKRNCFFIYLFKKNIISLKIVRNKFVFSEKKLKIFI